MTLRRVLQLGLVLVCVSIGCSWLIEPLESEPRCSSDAGVATPCPPGLTCLEGRCQRPCGMERCGDFVDNDCDDKIDEPDPDGRETCGDQIDNDCDGNVDEDSDRDGDGFTWCGDTVGGTLAQDCDDTTDAAVPNGVEVCDGINNDCSGGIDEGVLCAPGEFCSKELGRCTKHDCTSALPEYQCKPGEACSARTGACEQIPAACAGVNCPADEECVEGRCVKRGPLSNGQPCLNDDECLSGVCTDAAALRLKQAIKICVEACCSDAQCQGREPQQRCFVSGSGARSCLPASMIPAGAAKFPQCAHKESCGKEECALASDQSLLASSFDTAPQLTTPVCRPPAPNARGLGVRCQAGVVCASNLCVDAVFSGTVCSLPCGDSSQCSEFGKAALWTDDAYCRYVTVRPGTFGRPSDYAAACVVRREGEPGKGKWGDQCKSPLDCLERGCVTTPDGLSRCSPTCCDNSSCKTDSGTQRTCRPFKLGMGYEMRCDTVFP